MSGFEDDGLCSEYGHDYETETHLHVGEPYDIRVCIYCGDEYEE